MPPTVALRRTLLGVAALVAFTSLLPVAGPAQTAPATAPPKATPATPAAPATRSGIPTPESVFGFSIGADGKLVDYDQSIGYFKKLAAASNRIKLITVGKTSYGKSWTAVVISSPENLANLDHYKQINARLAHPAGLTDSAAHALARQGKAFVDISGGLHASETAGSQHTPQLAYELLSKATQPGTKEIFDNVIFFLWPSINPDGQDIVVNNCRGTGPNVLYQKYVGHDNNRDSYMLNVVESRVIAHTWREWEPDIIYVHHQAPPQPYRIWIPPFADPVGMRASPIMASTVNVIGTRIAAELGFQGKPGAVHMLDTFDAYYPGYIDYMPMYQNIAAWWTETQGPTCSTTAPGRPVSSNDSIPRALYVYPWLNGSWGMRDAVDYMVTASIATLNYAAKFREELLYNRYQAGRNTIQQFATSGPYAYVIPQTQRDPAAPVELLRRLAFLGVRVHQADRDFTYDGASYAKGTWVIPMDQEFAALVRELLEVQRYPAFANSDTPYDAAGWTLPYQMGVDVIEGKTPLPADVRTSLKLVAGKADVWGASPDYPFTTNAMAAGIVPAPSAITGTGSQLLLDPAQNNSFRLINRSLATGASLRVIPPTGSSGARYVLSGGDSSKVAAWAKELWVSGERASSAPTSIAAPTRIGVYRGSANNMDEGWTEWLFDTHEFKYTIVLPADIAAGNLGAKFDVIIFGPQSVGGGGRGGGGGGRGGAGGGGRGAGAPDPATTPLDPASQAVDEFVRGGGTIVGWAGGATGLATALRLLRNVIAGVPKAQYFTGISVVQILTDPTHPVMSGMPAVADVIVSGSPVFTTVDGFDGSVLAKYPSDKSSLRSGFVNGDQLMRGYAAAVDVKRDRGHVILFAFHPNWRGQPMGSFRMVFNSAFFARDVSANAKGAAGFWTAPPPK